MIQDVRNRPISELFDVDSRVVYVVPQYQREYTWGKSEWEALLDDLLENSPGYFLGSLICINQAKDALEVQRLEIVDGQQRLVTLSLLFAAIYRKLKSRENDLDEDQRVDLINLKRKLVLKNSDDQIRVVPQIQNDNQSDYRSVLSDVRVIEPCEARPRAGNRRIYRAVRYFQNRIDAMTDGAQESLVAVMGLLERVNRACLVKIEVANHADAYTLFESLNNRGVPLTAIDLIKNRLLSRLEAMAPGKMDSYSGRWSELLSNLGDDYTVQERFLRHHYNAFKDELNAPFRVQEEKRQDPLGPLATRSNLIEIYQKLIDQNAKGFLDRVSRTGKLYSLIVGRRSDDSPRSIEKPLQDLERIEGAPSHLLILHLLARRTEINLSSEQLGAVVSLLVRFFIRRNLTDTPPTRDLTRLFMTVLEELQSTTGEVGVATIRRHLARVSASDESFHSSLQGAIYDENSRVTRFILCALAEQAMTDETWVDLWRMDGKQPVWTIEHVFPQGDNIPESWISMIADGDAAKARELQKTHVHKLGNLTISGFNSTLSNRSFQDKRDRTDDKGRPVGYKNGLVLNEDLAVASRWSVEQIDGRTEKLVTAAIRAFALE